MTLTDGCGCFLEHVVIFGIVFERTMHCQYQIYNSLELTEICFVKYVHNSMLIITPVMNQWPKKWYNSLQYASKIGLFRNTELSNNYKTV